MKGSGTNCCRSTTDIDRSNRPSRLPRWGSSSIISSLSRSNLREGFRAAGSSGDFAKRGRLSMRPQYFPDRARRLRGGDGQPRTQFRPQLLGRKAADQNSVIREGNHARLLGDDDRNDVRLLRDPEAGAVPHAEHGVPDSRRLGEGKRDPRRLDHPVTDDDGAVVKRRPAIKDGDKEG